MSSIDVGGAVVNMLDQNQHEPVLTENARKVLEARYLKKNEAGECTEAPGRLFRRVAKTIADVEVTYGGSGTDRARWEDRFYKLMTTGDFMPNSPTLMNAGREMGMLSACFVLPVRDSIDEIFNSIKHTALIQKAGGGTGFAFDELRPTGDFINSSGGTTSGPISFWRAFSEATNAIQQGAFRRGANMGMMYVHHPDILKFLHAKQDLTQFTNYNISIKMTDVWMQEFLANPDSPHVVRNPRTGVCFLLPRELEIWKYDVRSLIETNQVEDLPQGDRAAAYYSTPQFIGDLPEVLQGKVYTKRDIWDHIIKNAWQTGEPGVVFMDRINEANPTPHVGRMEATNPCGEQPLLPYEACNLGSINLGNFIRNECTPNAQVDWDALRECVHVSTRYLDNVIDANNYPLPEIDAVCKANRKIGLGIMGFADALYKLNVAYNSDDGVTWGERFMRFVNDEAHNYSEHLAKLRGCFPNWKGSHWDTKYRRLMRNSCSTTVAPTGTISIIANCSGGIEPMFSLAFIRNVLRGQKQGEKPLVEVNDTFRNVAAARGFLSDALLERIATEGTLAHIAEIPNDIKRVFVCAHDIAPVWHMRMQAAFQRHNDSSISKTINFPHAASVEEVDEIYRLAFQMRCKGVTVYRDGCRNHQPMALKESGKKHEAASSGASLQSWAGLQSGAGLQPASATERRSDEATKGSADVSSAISEPAAQARGQGSGFGVQENMAAVAVISEPQAQARGAVLSEPQAQARGTNGNGNGNGHDHAAAPDLQSKIQNPKSKIESGGVGFQPVDRALVHGIEDRVADDMARIAARAQAPQPPAAPRLDSASPRFDPASPRTEPAAPRLEPADLAEIVSGLRIRQLTPFGNMHVKITVDPRTDRELEVFAQLGKGGDVATSDLEAICRMISLWLRSGGSLKHVIKQLEGIGSSLQIPTKFGRIMSLGDGLACALKKYMRAKERFGLKSLLLGEVDLSQLDTPRTPAVMDHLPGASVGANGSGGASSKDCGMGFQPVSATERRSDEATKGSAGVSPALSEPAAPARATEPPAPARGATVLTGPAADRFSIQNPKSKIQNEVAAFESRITDSAVLITRTDSTAAESAAAIGAGDAHDHDFAGIVAVETAEALVDETLVETHDEFAAVESIAGVEETISELSVEAEKLSTEHWALSTSSVTEHRRHFHDSAQYFKLACPECGTTLALQEGCRKCHGCGWSAC